jgi:Oxidoreductase molybdopterin binding domain
MAGRRTNLALLVALTITFFTGALAFAIGSGWNRWAIASHAIAGLVIVLLTPWKSVIAKRGLKRHRDGRAESLAFTALIVAAIASGVLHAMRVLSVAHITSMQIHVAAALLAVPLAVVHVRTRRVRVHRTDVSRRQLIRAGALIGGGAVTYAVVETGAKLGSRDGARRFTGSYETGSMAPERMPVTQWLDDSVQAINADDWHVSIGGRRLTYRELWEWDDSVLAALDCTGGWWAEQQWSGVLLSRLLPDDTGARSIVVTSATGYGRHYPMGDTSRLLLATRVGGRPLSAGHGFPARIVAPGRRGFWWVKWVVRVEPSDRPWWMQPPFPLT